jgi:AcrR family transcriptional regulator
MHTVSESPRRRLTRAEQQALTRRRVLEAADAVFSEEGFHAARLEGIAERAGYTRGAVYSNFKDKNDLALAIIERRVYEARATLEQAAAESGGSVKRARDSGDRVSALMHGERPWGPLFLEFVTHAARHPKLAERLTALYRELGDALADMLAASGVRASAGGQPTPQRLALVMLAATDGAALERMIDPERADAELAGDILGLIVAGLGAGGSMTT